LVLWITKEEIPDMLDQVHFHQREKFRERRDIVEHNMRVNLASLDNEVLKQNPLDG
jgi:hypothetical protein